MLLNVNLLGDLRRITLSWWRSVRISTSREARDRNSPTRALQISLQRFAIEQKHYPIRCHPPARLDLR